MDCDWRIAERRGRGIADWKEADIRGAAMDEAKGEAARD